MWQFIGQDKQRSDGILTRSKAFYLPMAEKMEPTSRTYLENIKEVPVPSTFCGKPQTNSIPSPTLSSK